MSDHCALDANQNPLPANEILFYNSESDETPLPPIKGTSFLFELSNMANQPLEPRRSTRSRQTDKLTESLAAEKQDEDGKLIRVKQRALPPRKAANKSVVLSSDEEDDDFQSDSDSSDDSDSCPSLMSLDNDEVFFFPFLYSPTTCF
jgi:hypothetical protein